MDINEKMKYHHHNNTLFLLEEKDVKIIEGFGFCFFTSILFYHLYYLKVL